MTQAVERVAYDKSSLSSARDSVGARHLQR
jgi:hypothetical protein